ncbi:stalk domain-containing protein [Paenibacillus aestuarii]|uniref:Stalk domain-containing protein n=1 Tax=Paenibacillus aestuarii TaxID=516965 RepID=A0ABW0K2Y6_9BACL|nr:stalk domain-containing protein [Paenibacillus aestuarii]
MNLKKKVLIATGITAIVAAAFSIGVYAASDIKLFINGKQTSADVQIIDGSSYVPLRVVSEMLGANVKWDGDARTITITSGPSGNSGPSSNVSSNKAGVFAIDDFTVKKDDIGIWRIAGDVKNTDSKDYKSIHLTAAFYDESGKRLGTAGASLFDLKQGDIKTADFATSDDLSNYATVRFQVDVAY